MIHIKCALSFCDIWVQYKIPDNELDDGPKASLFNFSVYTYQGICETHGINPNGPSLCRICEENNDKSNGVIKRPTYGNKKYLYKNIIFYWQISQEAL